MDIDLDAIVWNWRALNSSALARVGASIKANAYGLGATPVAVALDAAGCRDYFVATLSEAQEIARALGAAAGSAGAAEGRRIYVLNGFAPDATGLVAAEGPGPRIAPVIGTLQSWRAWVDVWRIGAANGARAPVAGLQFETGMNRIGLDPADIEQLKSDEFPSGGRLTAMSHLASADEPDSPQTDAQRAAFEAGVRALRVRFPDVEASLAATGGLVRDPALAYDLARPGVGLFGGAPFAGARPVVELTAPILRVWEVEAGAQVGYGATWTAERRTRLATAAIGYADGLPRALSNKGWAHVSGARAPIVGRVSMDLTVLDVSAHPGDLRLGERAVFLAHGPNAPQELGIEAMAAEAGTIGYEILTRLGAAPRVARRYRGGPQGGSAQPGGGGLWP